MCPINYSLAFPLPSKRGVQRGVTPLARNTALWRMCLHKLLFFSFYPLPLRKGAGGMVRATSAANPPIARAQRTQPFDRALGPSPSTTKQESALWGCPQRESRGRSHLAGVWGCPPDVLFTSPFLLGRGPGGWSEPRARRTPQSRAPRGRSPLTALWGCPQHL